MICAYKYADDGPSVHVLETIADSAVIDWDWTVYNSEVYAGTLL